MLRLTAALCVLGVVPILLAQAASSRPAESVAELKAQLPAADQQKIAAKDRAEFKLEAHVARIRAGEVEAGRLSAIHHLFRSTREFHIHKQRGASGNQIFLHADGHAELVFGPDQKRVADGINDGSYNYFHPTNDAARHFAFDIHPWIQLGNSRRDPTTVKERISAHMLDLQEGILVASRSQRVFEVKPAELRNGEAEAYALMLRIVEAGDAAELFPILAGTTPATPERLADVMRKLERGFLAIYN